MTTPGTLFCFGVGYSAMALSRRLDAAGWTIRGTCRKPARKAALGALGISAALFDGESPMDSPDLLQGATHVLLSIPPGADGDPAYRHHAKDIATVVAASIARPQPGGIYNVCDDEPAAPADIVTYVCELLGREPPPEIPYDETEMSPMARSFWSDNRRVRNDRIKEALGVELDFPDYRIGIRGILGLGG